MLLVGASHFIQQMFQAFFLINCTNLSELVRTGKLDFLLLLPVNTRFVVSLRQVDLGAFVNAASALAVMGYAARQLHLVPTAMQVVGFLVLCVGGHCDPLLADVPAGQHQLLDRARAGHRVGLLQPLQHRAHARRGLSRAVQGPVSPLRIPMLLVSNVPVRLLADKLTSPKPLLLLLAMSVVCFCISEWGWRASVRRYTSASS